MDCGFVDLSDLVGIPFVDRGRTKDGADCFGVFSLAMERFGIAVPEVSMSAYASETIFEEIRKRKTEWHRVEVPSPGDAVVMRHDPLLPEVEQHLGVYLGAGRFIHSIQKVGSMIVRIDHPIWKNKITGFYRWTK